MSFNQFNRQDIEAAVVDLGIADIAGGGYTVKLPPGAYLLGTDADVITAFDTDGSTPTCKLTVTDGTTVAINAQSVMSTGDVTVASEKKFFPSGGTLTGTLTEGVASGSVTTATVGRVIVCHYYVVVGVGEDNYG